MEEIDDDLGVEGIWGAVTRKERRVLKGDTNEGAGSAMMLRMMKTAHMFSEDGGQNIRHVDRFQAAKLWGLGSEKLREMGAVIPRS